MAQVSREGRYLRVNRKFCQMLGYTEQELLERTLFDITHPDDRNISAVKLDSSYADESAEYSLEKRYIRKDGAVIWVLISEIFPNRHRAEGQALGSFTHWIFAALLTTFFPKMVTAFAPGYVFLFFCGMMVLQLLWVKFMVPETKGISLEDMQRKLGIEAELSGVPGDSQAKAI